MMSSDTGRRKTTLEEIMVFKQLSTDSLRFLDPPSLRQNVDGSIEIETVFESQALPDIQWKFGSTEDIIASQLNGVEGRLKTTFVRRNDETCSSTLRIEGAGDADAGMYKCDISSDAACITALIEVKKDFFKRPFFIQKTGFHLRDNGRIVIMDFRVRSPKKITANWSQDGLALPKSRTVNFVHRKENADTYYGALILCRDSASEAAQSTSVYECRIKNEHGEIVASYGQEQSSGLPHITRPLSGRHMVKDHVHIALFDVGFASVSEPTVTWWNIRGKPLAESGRVKVQVLKESDDGIYTARMQLANWGERDAGRYTCMIENECGKTAADVVFREVTKMSDSSSDEDDMQKQLAEQQRRKKLKLKKASGESTAKDEDKEDDEKPAEDEEEEEEDHRSFADLGLCPELVEACLKLGWKEPSKIQKAALPAALSGKDVIGLAETGSGKTGAFALPILQSLLERQQKLFALVLTPTRELAYQIAQQFEALGTGMGVMTAVIVGGVEMVNQAMALAKRPHIIVATPGRLVDHLENTRGFNLKALKYLVMDEADRILNMDFEAELDKILKVVPRERNTYLFSATMTKKVAKLERASLKNPARVEVNSRYKTVDKLKQNYVFIPHKYKDAYLVYLLNEHFGKSVIVFTATCAGATRTSAMLKNLGMGSVALHGQLSQQKRISHLNKFKSKSCNILVCTDVASRGLDIPHVDAVMNFDVPTQSKDYVHRVGRTARAGRAGLAVTFVTQYDVEQYQKIEQHIGKKLEEYPTVESDVMEMVERVAEAGRMAKDDLKEMEEKKKFGKKRGHDDDDDMEESQGGLRKKGKMGGKKGGGKGGKMQIRNRIK